MLAMHHPSKNFQFRRCLEYFVMITFLGSFILEIESFNFSYLSFNKNNEGDFFTTEDSEIFKDAIQVTLDVLEHPKSNISGRVWYNKPVKLWSQRKNITASFNSTFNINITPQTDPGGEGMAFILTKEKGFVPENSHGHWLGIVNETTNGSASNNIVAIEFDTRKSSPEDLDNNHVGVNINSISSINPRSLTERNINLSGMSNVTARINYNGEAQILNVFVFMSDDTGDNTRDPVISMPLNLSDYLPEDVFIGFSASTGVLYMQLNCITAWNFTIVDIDNDDEEEKNLLLWILIPAGVAVLLLIGSFWVYKYMKNKKINDIYIPSTAPKKFPLKILRRATNNFNTKNVLGRGGCGIVYKGLLNKKEIAVKRFSKDSSQGEQTLIAEVTTIDNLHHKNLVKLIGWCYESNELLVVYEFMPNGSLDKILFDKTGLVLSWERRVRIISGVAQALDYLHNGGEKKILHRDVKPSNIMLDGEFNARLGDFGLARTVHGYGKSHHTTKEIAGTLGYMAPETFHTGRATVETDIYAFGVLTLEVTCGKSPLNIDKEHDYDNGIINYVWNMHDNNTIVDAIDINLKENFEKEEAESLLKLGLACCHPNPYERPSIRSVVQVLNGEMIPPSVQSKKPAFVWPTRASSLDSSHSGSQLTVSTLHGR